VGWWELTRFKNGVTSEEVILYVICAFGAYGFEGTTVLADPEYHSRASLFPLSAMVPVPLGTRSFLSINVATSVLVGTESFKVRIWRLGGTEAVNTNDW
jgi:hypothetical protein